MNLGTRDYTTPRTPSFGQKRRPLLIRAVAKESPLRTYDWVLLVAVVALSLIGTLLVYSATQPSADPRSYLIKQLINVALGVILMVVVSLLDYRQIRLLAPFVYTAPVLGLAAVLSPLGTSVSGAKAWINLPAASRRSRRSSPRSGSSSSSPSSANCGTAAGSPARSTPPGSSRSR